MRRCRFSNDVVKGTNRVSLRDESAEYASASDVERQPTIRTALGMARRSTRGNQPFSRLRAGGLRWRFISNAGAPPAIVTVAFPHIISQNC